MRTLPNLFSCFKSSPVAGNSESGPERSAARVSGPGTGTAPRVRALAAADLPRAGHATTDARRLTLGAITVAAHAPVENAATFEHRLSAWVADCPPDQRRGRHAAAEKIATAHRNGASKLELIDMALTSLPDCLCELTALRELEVGVNRLTGLPALPKGLTALHAAANALETLPELPPGLIFP